MTSEIKSLHELCFENIRKNISRHTAAHLSTKDPTLLRNISFLQRFHTQNLIDELVRHRELREEHFDFLLNEFLKKLVISPFLRCSTKERIVEKVLPIAHNLHELSSVCEDSSDEDYVFILRNVLPHSTNVKILNIPYICSDELLMLIASSCSQLVKLGIQESRVTGDGIKALCSNCNGRIHVKCPLKYLNLCDNSLQIEDVAFVLKNMPTLEEVLFSDLPETIGFIDLNGENETFNLKSLDFIRYDDPLQVAKLVKICSVKCPETKSLSLPIYNATDLELINCFSKLETLSLVCCSVQDYNAIDLNKFLTCKGKDIKHLTVDCFSLCVTKLIDNCSNLETLILKNITWQQLEESSGKLLIKLHTLVLDSVIFLDSTSIESVMAILNSSPDLKSLTMQYCDFGETDIISNLSTFSLQCNLNHLNFECTDVGVDLLQQFIINCNSIRSLSIDSCENMGLEDVAMLHETVEASNRKIEINFVDSDAHSDFSYSDYGAENEDDFDFHFYGEFDGYSDYDYDDDDDDNGYDFGCSDEYD